MTKAMDILKITHGENHKIVKDLDVECIRLKLELQQIRALEEDSD